MAKHNPTKPIPPFPADIDRAYFGAWLSGFTDGEGCFRLTWVNRTKSKYHTPVADFGINLRQDDTDALLLVQSCFSCGKIYMDKRSYSINSKAPKTTFRVMKIADIIGVVIPHFTRFPLIAKKAADFYHFKRGAELISTVAHRPFKSYRGRLCRWTEEERQQFSDIQEALHTEREFRPYIKW